MPNSMIEEAVIRGRAIEGYVTKISREIVYALKSDEIKNHLSQNGIVQFMLNATEVLSKVDNLSKIGVSLEEGSHVGAEAQYSIDFDNRDDSYLVVNLTVPEGYDDRVFFELIPDLKDTLRHEFEHVSQETSQLSDLPEIHSLEHLWSDLGIAEQYYTGEAEVAAYVAGLYKKAKTQKRPVTDILNERLLNIFNTGVHFGYSEEELKPLIVKIGETWFEHLQGRYPNWREE